MEEYLKLLLESQSEKEQSRAIKEIPIVIVYRLLLPVAHEEPALEEAPLLSDRCMMEK